MDRQKSKEAVLRIQRRKKIDAVEKFGGKCSICGYNKCINALEFHHLGNKKEKPSYIIMRWSWERSKKELEKCILVCSNCHREIHYNHMDASLLKRYSLPFISKICLTCNDKFDTKNVDQVFCSHPCHDISQRKVNRPDLQDLKNLIVDKIPFVQIGRMYGVSDNAVRKWAKQYGIQWKKRKRTNS